MSEVIIRPKIEEIEEERDIYYCNREKVTFESTYPSGTPYTMKLGNECYVLAEQDSTNNAQSRR